MSDAQETQVTEVVTETPETSCSCGSSCSCKRPSKLSALAFVVSLVALGASLTQPLWQGKLYGERALSQDDMATVASDYFAAVDGLKGELNALKTQLEAKPDLSPLEARLSALENKPAPEPAPAPKIDMSAVETLRTEMAELRTQLKERHQQDSLNKVLLVALLQLITAWQNGQPFDSPWQTAMNVVEASDPELAALLNDLAPVLLPWRDQGLATLGTLQGEFAETARSVVQASRPKAATWWGQSLQNLKGLVTIRRQGSAIEAGDASVEAKVARAEERLKAGDLNGAVEALDGLQDGAAEAAQKWVEQARARAQADAVTSKIISRMAASLAPEGNADTGHEGTAP